MSPLLLVALLLIVVYKIYEYYKNYPKNAPPALPCIPIVGSYWHLLWGNYKFPHKAVEYYTKKLNSKLVSWYFGPFFSIIANDYKSIKEILSREEFDGRLTEVDVIKARAYGKKLGIFFVDGEQWQEQRRFALRHMRDFGFGRRQEKYESIIAEEMATFVDFLKNGPINNDEKTVLKDGQALFPNVLFAYSGNAIWQVMSGETLGRNEHHKLRNVGEYAMIFQRAGDTSGGAIFQFSFLKYFGNVFGYKGLVDGTYGVANFVKEYLELNKEADNEAHDADTDKGMIGRYLEAIKTSDEKTYFSKEQLILTIVDFMFPALTAMPTVVTNAIKFMLHYPEIMEKVRNEIDTVVGNGRLVTWEDRKNLPYTEATIRETMRIETITPFGVLHRCTKDTTLAGYNIPKDTGVITNLAAMNHDPELWGDPENFRPERFLQESFSKDPSFPFGFGHRVCAGETFARYNLFGLFAVLMQNFKFSFIEGQPNSLEDKLPGVIVTPKDLWLRVETR